MNKEDMIEHIMSELLDEPQTVGAVTYISAPTKTLMEQLAKHNGNNNSSYLRTALLEKMNRDLHSMSESKLSRSMNKLNES